MSVMTYLNHIYKRFLKKYLNDAEIGKLVTITRLLQGFAVLLGIVTTVFIIYDRTKQPDLGSQLLLRIGGFELRVFNNGNALATNIHVDVFAWQCGSPGTELNSSFSVHDLSSGADSIIYNIMSGGESSKKGGLIGRSDRLPVSGYMVLSCNSCVKPKAWAFYVPEWSSKQSRSEPFVKSDWPMAGFDYPKEVPGIGFCVDYPRGVCAGSRCSDYSRSWVWQSK